MFTNSTVCFFKFYLSLSRQTFTSTVFSIFLFLSLYIVLTIKWHVLLSILFNQVTSDLLHVWFLVCCVLNPAADGIRDDHSVVLFPSLCGGKEFKSTWYYNCITPSMFCPTMCRHRKFFKFNGLCHAFSTNSSILF